MTRRLAAIRSTISGEGAYPERIPLQLGVLDKAAAGLASLVPRRRNAPEKGDCAAYRVEVGRAAENLRGAPLAQTLTILRYRLRRDGYAPDLIRDCLAHCSLALEQGGLAWPEPEAYVAARELLLGRFVALADRKERVAALMLAATSAALAGDPVHLIAPDSGRARELSAQMVAYAHPLSLSVALLAPESDLRARRAAYGADIVCATVQTFGLDYLRDRLQQATRPGDLNDAALRLAGDAPRADRLLLRGLHQAFVEDADLVMLDDARIPLMIAVDTEVPGERLLYEQALELARALSDGEHFVFAEGMPVLTEAGRERLARLVSALGGIWSAPGRREELIAIALRALHEFQRDRDYRINRGRIEFPPQAGQSDGEPSAGDRMLIRLVEVKEGCALSGRREILGRLSVPGFLGRYLHISGVGFDWGGSDGELRKLYGVATVNVAPARLRVPVLARLFATTAARVDAVAECAASADREGLAVLIILRSPQDAEFWVQTLADRGMAPAVIRGGPDAGDPGVFRGVAVGCATALASMSGGQQAGPLCMLIPELPGSRRYVARLSASCAATRVEFLVATEDEAFMSVMPAVMTATLASRADGRGEIRGRLAAAAVNHALRMLEREQRIQREELVARDLYLTDSLAFAARQA
jgi:preprotein translocase subunit SecA